MQCLTLENMVYPARIWRRGHSPRFGDIVLGGGDAVNRREFLTMGAGAAGAMALPALAFQNEKSKLKITGVRLVKTTPRKPPPKYTPAPGSWSTGGVEVANPMSI